MKLPAGTLTNLIPIEFVIESASWQQTAYGHEVTTSNKTSLLKLKLKRRVRDDRVLGERGIRESLSLSWNFQFETGAVSWF